MNIRRKQAAKTKNKRIYKAKSRLMDIYLLDIGSSKDNQVRNSCM
jgi:hypothetical protein